MASEVRVRYAPSPTGYQHVGNARTALFNWLFARGRGGRFVLRIEDTDVERSKPRYEEAILEDLRWLGLDWDEGPDVGGPYGPYRQSERLPIYREHAERLLRAGLAYECYCTEEELEARRQEARLEGRPPRYDNRCRGLDEAQRRRLRAQGRRAVLRLRLPHRRVLVRDLVRGRCRFDTSLLGDPVILRADGRPTYHLAVVVDDALMRITHVIRGEGHLPNTPIHLMLFEALGYEPPAFAHLPHTLSAEGGKLSKRFLEEEAGECYLLRGLRRRGYPPEAVVAALARLGWSPGGEGVLGLEELARRFDLEKVKRTPGFFDPARLEHLGRTVLRGLGGEELARRALPYLREAGLVGREGPVDTGRLSAIMEVSAGEAPCLAELVEQVEFFFRPPVLGGEARRGLERASARVVLSALLGRLRGAEGLEPEGFRRLMSEVSAETGLRGRDLYEPVRLALTGRRRGPELERVAALLGPEECRARLRRALEEAPAEGPGR